MKRSYPAYLLVVEPRVPAAFAASYNALILVFCHQMNRVIFAGFIGLTCAVALSAQAPAPAPPASRSTPPAPSSAVTPVAPAGVAPVLDAAAERDLLNRYCVGCHSERAKAAGMDSARKISLDSIDLSNVHPHAEKLELVVRKLRAGMMPPAGARRPEPAVYKAMTAWLENELDRTATPYTPPPGLHRLNRTEYANAVRDLLDLDIDPAKYLPSDDSTHGFDNIAGTLGISSTLVEAYVSAAGKISRLAVGEATPPTLVVDPDA